MNAYATSPKLPATFREALAVALEGTLTDGEAVDFLNGWLEGHRTGVTFWLDTIAFRRGLPCRWCVPAIAA